jgi:hypothetical protein
VNVGRVSGKRPDSRKGREKWGTPAQDDKFENGSAGSAEALRHPKNPAC